MAGDFFAFTTLALLVQDSEIREYWRPQLRSLTLREGTQGLNSYESLVFLQGELASSLALFITEAQSFIWCMFMYPAP